MPKTISLKVYLDNEVGPCPSCIAFNRAIGSISYRALNNAITGLLNDMQDWQERRNRARDEYERLVACGEIIIPTSQQELEMIAAGHPDKESTLAARRVLEKRKARMGGKEDEQTL